MVFSFKKMNAEAYLPDIDNEKPDNYRYDKIGNLIRDRAEGIDTIKWTVYGKIHQIVKATGDVITYGYDAGGNRTSKQVTYTDTTVSTYYLRDAQGNVLAVYGHTSYNNEVKWKEQHLYGSSRLGMWRSDTVVAPAPPVVQNNGTLYDSLLYGSRTYELTNHLGNVMVTISDKKVGVDSAADGTVAYYTADVRTAQDYYPFGMLMPGRMTYEGDYRWVPVDPSQIPEDVPADLVLDQPRVSGDPAECKATNSITMQPDFSSMTGDEFLAHIVEDDGLDPSDYATASRYSGVRSEYRYGFNGKENDDDVKGTGNQQDYGMRIYDSRLGKFLSVDPLFKTFVWNSPYAYAENDVVRSIDLDGKEKLIYLYNFQDDIITKTEIELVEAGPLGNGVLVQSNHGGVTTYYYGNKISNPTITSFKKAYEGVTVDKNGNHVGYKDHLGNPTIGYGHLIKKDETYTVGGTITETEAERLFNEDSKSIFEKADEYLSNYNLTETQKNSLYDASFNMGPGKMSQYSEDGGKFSGEFFFLKFMAGGDGIKKRRFAESLLYAEGLCLHLDVLKSDAKTKQAKTIIDDYTGVNSVTGSGEAAKIQESTDEIED